MAMILYKYRQDGGNTENIFTSGKVWLAKPAALNDPFEASLQPIDPAFSADKVEKMKQLQLVTFLLDARRSRGNKRFFGLDDAQIDALLARFESFRELDQAYAALRDFMAVQKGQPLSEPANPLSQLPAELASVGIFSLSEVADDELMWAHYATDKGLSLGFEVQAGSALADAARCMRVVYSNAPIPALGEDFHSQLRITIDAQGRTSSRSRIPLSDPDIRAAITTKSTHWAYEREWRYVEPTSGAFDWPGRLVEITFGLNLPQARREYYARLARAFVPNPVQFHEMRKVSNMRTLQRVLVTMPTPAPAAALPPAQLAEIGRLLDGRDHAAALSLIEILLAADPASAELWRCKGIALGWSDDAAGALASFDHAIAINPGDSSIWYQKGVALTQLQRFGQALQAYEAALRLGASDPSVAFNTGVVLVQLERYDEALLRLAQARRQGHPRAAAHIEAVKARRPVAR